jgi:hypothetical protein
MSGAHDLEVTAAALVTKGKGILAADESSPTIEKRFKSIGVESTEDNRRSYRELLFTTPGIDAHISGVILFDETIRQAAADGTALVEVLTRQGILPGIKVDTGAKPLAGAPGEKITEGLDGLRDRLSEYRELGARFAKWRAVIAIGDGLPSRYCLEANAEALARYAALSHCTPPLRRSTPSGWCTSRRCSSRTWCCAAPGAPNRPASRRWRGRPCAVCGGPCPRRCRGSCFCREDRPPSWRPPTSMP